MNNSSSTLTLERLKECLHYDPLTGIFTWLKVTTNRVSVGDPAGSWTKVGYIKISVDNCKAYAHRLAWFYSFGVWPSGPIDHIDRVKTNNALKNLRQVTNAENIHNMDFRKDNKSGIRGVSWDKKNKKWTAKICLHRKQMYLGLFATLDDANRAYQTARDQLHPAYISPSNKIKAV